MSDPQAQAIAQAVGVIVQYAPLVAKALANPNEPIEGMSPQELVQLYAQQVQQVGAAQLGAVYASLPADQRRSVAEVMQTNTMAELVGYRAGGDPAVADFYQTMGNDRFTDPTTHNVMTQKYGDMVNMLDRDTYDQLQAGRISPDEAYLRLLELQRHTMHLPEDPGDPERRRKVDELPDHIAEAGGRRPHSSPLAITARELAENVHVHLDPGDGDVDVSFDVGGFDVGGFDVGGFDGF